jgi:hypothetical protein
MKERTKESHKDAVSVEMARFSQGMKKLEQERRLILGDLKQKLHEKALEKQRGIINGMEKDE